MHAHGEKAMQDHSEMRAIYKEGRKVSKETSPSNTLDFQPPELWDNKSLLLSHPVCYFVMVALAN